MAITATIDLGDSNLGIGQTTGVTFVFSVPVSDFTLADVSAENGTLTGLTTSDNTTYTATLTPTPGLTDTSNVITVDLAGVTNAQEGAGSGTAMSSNYTLDAQRPVATIVVADTALAADQTSLVTFTFSEAVVGLSNDDLSAPNGTLSGVNSSDGGITWTATFTPSVGVADASNVITLDNSGVMDAAGNAGTGTTNSNNYAIQTVRPTAIVIVSDSALRANETSLVTVTFSEAVSGFDNTKLTVPSGTLSNMSSSNGGVTWTATLTPTASVTAISNLITLDMSGIFNGAGNSGVGTVASNAYAVDTLRPTASLVVADAALEAGETSLVTVTFSEAVSGLTTADLIVENGALSGLSTTDGGVTWTATLTPTSGVTDAANIITLDLTGVQDGAGNVGVGSVTSNSYQVGYVPPEPPSEDDVIFLPPRGASVAAGPGNDKVTGGDGADFIQGNVGADSLFGGAGTDIVRGGQDGDFVHGNVGADQLFGDLGDDSVFGGQGDDFVQGGVGADYVLGDLGRDTVLGGQGDDNIAGGEGADYLSGDLGDDVLVGGAGADLFNFTGGAGRDVVMDFSHSDGDLIRISPSDAADFMALSAKFVADASGTVVQLGAQTILLVGVAPGSLTAADFVFG